MKQNNNPRKHQKPAPFNPLRWPIQIIQTAFEGSPVTIISTPAGNEAIFHPLPKRVALQAGKRKICLGGEHLEPSAISFRWAKGKLVGFVGSSTKTSHTSRRMMSWAFKKTKEKLTQHQFHQRIDKMCRGLGGELAPTLSYRYVFASEDDPRFYAVKNGDAAFVFDPVDWKAEISDSRGVRKFKDVMKKHRIHAYYAED